MILDILIHHSFHDKLKRYSLFLHTLQWALIFDNLILVVFLIGIHTFYDLLKKIAILQKLDFSKKTFIPGIIPMEETVTRRGLHARP